MKTIDFLQWFTAVSFMTGTKQKVESQKILPPTLTSLYQKPSLRERLEEGCVNHSQWAEEKQCCLPGKQNSQSFSQAEYFGDMKSGWILFLRGGFIKQPFYYAHLLCVRNLGRDTEMLVFASWSAWAQEDWKAGQLDAQGLAITIFTLSVAIFGEDNQFIIKDTTQEQPNTKHRAEWGRAVELPHTLPPPSS